MPRGALGEDNVHLFDPAASQRALSDVYCQQIAKYRDALASLQVGHLFRPLVVDGFGAWGTHAFAVMSTCASRALVASSFLVLVSSGAITGDFSEARPS